VCDFIENFQDLGALGFAGKILKTFLDSPSGAIVRPCPPNSLIPPQCSPEHSLYTNDPEAFQAACSRILAWGCRRIIMCHGGVIEGAKECEEAIVRARDLVLKRVSGRFKVTSKWMNVMSRFQ